MVRRSGLGTGLSALIPGEQGAAGTAVADGVELRELPIEAIRPNRYQPRTQFDDPSLAELAASVAEVGVLQPILVRHATAGDGYELIAGERRWRAARRAGLVAIPALIQDRSSDLHSLELALIENLHRSDLNPLEEAAAYQQLIDEFGLTHEKIAERVSKNRVTVTNTLRLLQLPAAVQGLLAEGRLTAAHGRALLGLADAAQLEETAAKVVAEGLNVKATEALVRRLNTGRGAEPAEADDKAAPGREPLPDAGISELEHLLERHLNTRVKVDLKGPKGRVIVEFADLDDLERIYRAVTGAAAT